jgi:hypothetical protein
MVYVHFIDGTDEPGSSSAAGEVHLSIAALVELPSASILLKIQTKHIQLNISTYFISIVWFEPESAIIW